MASRKTGSSEPGGRKPSGEHNNTSKRAPSAGAEDADTAGDSNAVDDFAPLGEAITDEDDKRRLYERWDRGYEPDPRLEQIFAGEYAYGDPWEGDDDETPMPFSFIECVQSTRLNEMTLLRRAHARRIPLLFRAEFRWPYRRFKEARSWLTFRPADAPDDDEALMEYLGPQWAQAPHVAAVLPLPFGFYQELVGPADRNVVVNEVWLEGGGIVVLNPLDHVLRVSDLLLDNDGYDALVAREPVLRSRRADDTKRERTELRIIRSFMQLMFSRERTKYGTPSEPNYKEFRSQLKKAGEHAGIDPVHRDVVTERLEAAMRLKGKLDKE